jgi:hypothetical protein
LLTDHQTAKKPATVFAAGNPSIAPGQVSASANHARARVCGATALQLALSDEGPDKATQMTQDNSPAITVLTVKAQRHKFSTDFQTGFSI